ncbi:Rhodanese-like protein [Panus rudis PR-1116 ss-1]|nr:Rhodanese-like protein [Panus rudis PR-1116 ss-1]
MSTSSTKPVPEWAQALPTPKSEPPTIDPRDLAELIRTKQPVTDFMVVDVRRNDFEAAFIRTAINLPAQSFYQTLDTILPLLQNTPKVIFHCQSCTPGGRGRRVAAWYQDALNERGIKSSQALVLDGGIKNWIAQFGGDESLTAKLT